jgi:hypothetical protein
VQDNDARRRSPASMKKTEQTMTLLWQGRRTSDRKESFRLFQLSSP